MESDGYETVRKIAAVHWWYVGRRAIVSALADPYLAPDACGALRVLSVGCGTGTEFAFLSRYGDVTGVDNDERAISYCRESGYGDRAICADVRSLPFPAASFDAAFALDVLEHVEDESAGVKGLFDALKPGGYCVVTVPAFEFLRGWADDYAMHFRRYRKSQLLRALRGGGFEVLRCTYFNTLLFPPIALFKVLLRRFEKKAALDAEFKLHGPFLNSLLTRMFAGERRIVSHWDLPFGVSLAAVARKPGSAQI